MGNGPGDFEDYFKAIQKDDRMCGGFVWEWCDHAIAHGKADNGKTIYYYGGDHGESIHDGNFCVDGLVYPDRTPHTGLLEYKNVYRPVRVVSYDQEDGTLLFHNYMDFDNLKDFVEIDYEMTQDGLTVEKGSVENLSAAPHSDGKTELKLQVPSAGKIYLKFIYILKKELPLLQKGYVLGFEEIKLENQDGRNQKVLEWAEKEESAGTIIVKESAEKIELQANAFSYTLNKRNGLFEDIQFAGRNYLNHPMELNIWRAPTDNDMYIKSEWKKAHYDKAYTRAYNIEVLQNKHGVFIMEHLAVVADTVQKIIDIELTWKIDETGKIIASIEAQKDEEFPDLPRFGIRLFLDKKFEDVAYYGMGPHESYRDKHQATSHGIYRSKVTDLHEDYIRPQENGSHYDCDYVELTNAQYGFAIVSEDSFSFNASYYTQEVLEQTEHNFELEESDSTVLCVDYALNGIGSNSCGPVVLDQYRFRENEFRFQLKLVPYVKR